MHRVARPAGSSVPGLLESLDLTHWNDPAMRVTRRRQKGKTCLPARLRPESAGNRYHPVPCPLQGSRNHPSLPTFGSSRPPLLEMGGSRRCGTWQPRRRHKRQAGQGREPHSTEGRTQAQAAAFEPSRIFYTFSIVTFFTTTSLFGLSCRLRGTSEIFTTTS